MNLSAGTSRTETPGMLAVVVGVVGGGSERFVVVAIVGSSTSDFSKCGLSTLVCNWKISLGTSPPRDALRDITSSMLRHLLSSQLYSIKVVVDHLSGSFKSHRRGVAIVRDPLDINDQSPSILHLKAFACGVVCAFSEVRERKQSRPVSLHRCRYRIPNNDHTASIRAHSSVSKADWLSAEPTSLALCCNITSDTA